MFVCLFVQCNAEYTTNMASDGSRGGVILGKKRRND